MRDYGQSKQLATAADAASTSPTAVTICVTLVIIPPEVNFTMARRLFIKSLRGYESSKAAKSTLLKRVVLRVYS